MTDKPEAVAFRYMLANGTHIVDTYRRVRFNGEPVFDETPLYAHPQPDASALVEIERALKDPVSVHVNMLRGVIAIPSLNSLAHASPEIAAFVERASALVEALRATETELERIVHTKATDSHAIHLLILGIRAAYRGGDNG